MHARTQARTHTDRQTHTHTQTMRKQLDMSWGSAILLSQTTNHKGNPSHSGGLFQSPPPLPLAVNTDPSVYKRPLRKQDVARHVLHIRVPTTQSCPTIPVSYNHHRCLASGLMHLNTFKLVNEMIWFSSETRHC